MRHRISSPRWVLVGASALRQTIFNALTAAGAESANYPFCTIEPNVGIVSVPDDRLDVIQSFIATQKVIPAVVEIVDIVDIVEMVDIVEIVEMVEMVKMVNMLISTIRPSRPS